MTTCTNVGSGSASFTFSEIRTSELSASSVDSQFPVDPHTPRRAPRRVARDAASSMISASLRSAYRPLSVDSQFPADPASRVAGDVRWLATLTQNLADALTPLHLGLQILELRTERIAGRHHADGSPFFDHRHVTKTVFEHHHQRVMERLVG
jgi:hypothetical protein